MPRTMTQIWYTSCYFWYSEEGTGRGRSPPRLLVAIPNVTAHPSTASVPITVFLYSGTLLCGFNMAIKGYLCKRVGACRVRIMQVSQMSKI